MSYLRKYGSGTGADVRIPIIKASSTDFAVGADWTPAAGDVKITKDGGAAANITTLPTALAMGNGAVWVFTFSDAELQAKEVVVTVVDASTKAITDQSFTIQTYGNASAYIIADLGSSSTGGLPIVGTGTNNFKSNSSANVTADIATVLGNSPLANMIIPPGPLGDYVVGDTIDFDFTTLTTLAGTPVVSVYQTNSLTETQTGVTLTVDFDGKTGLNHVRITTASDGTFYATNRDFQVVLTTGTVSGVSLAPALLASFSLAKKTVKQVGAGGGGGGAASADVNVVSINQVAATAVTAVKAIQGLTTADTVTTVSGNVGGNVTGSVGSVAGNVGGNVVGSVASVVAAVTISLAQALNETSVGATVGAALNAARAQGLGAWQISGTAPNQVLSIMASDGVTPVIEFDLGDLVSTPTQIPTSRTPV